MPDTRVVYGATCSWWDSIDKVGKKADSPHGLPCCPHCKGVLFEVDSIEKFMQGADAYEKDGHSGYQEFIKWLRGKCYTGRTFAEFFYAASLVYTEQTGKQSGMRF